MKNLAKRRSRYLQDSTPVRLGGLAANLGRVASFSKHADHQDVVNSILQESKWFIEWTAGDLEIDQAAELVRLQVQLALWQLKAQTEWSDESWRNRLAADSRQWSERLLEMSGLLKVN
ncbi:MAG: hypothetical protein ACE5IW_05525 [bacterium]